MRRVALSCAELCDVPVAVCTPTTTSVTAVIALFMKSMVPHRCLGCDFVWDATSLAGKRIAVGVCAGRGDGCKSAGAAAVKC